MTPAVLVAKVVATAFVLGGAARAAFLVWSVVDSSRDSREELVACFAGASLLAFAFVAAFGVWAK